MTANRWIVWALLTHGLTTIVTTSQLFAGVRRAVGAHWAAIRCPMCFGFWVGAALAAAGLDPTAELGWSWPAGLVAAGACSSAWCWAAHVMLVFHGSNRL